MTDGDEVRPTNMGLEGGDLPPSHPTSMTITFTYILIISSSPQKHSRSLSMTNLHDFFFGSLSHGSEQAHGVLLLAGGGQSTV
ncbi:hypothetical protein TNCT_478931 [Trichonephila clavata]|uniref:Uncharacterized protein n=1 Tax=Trichonephila clavata TaxID=2740835 RepID=A0A8X6L9R8_TRICU|nr:hypothetical protein TNCT_478931 [Trichonephila clavata]